MKRSPKAPDDAGPGPQSGAGYAGTSMAGTPDRRYVFFNTVLEGGTVTLVERRRDGDLAVN